MHHSNLLRVAGPCAFSLRMADDDLPRSHVDVLHRHFADFFHPSGGMPIQGGCTEDHPFSPIRLLATSIYNILEPSIVFRLGTTIDALRSTPFALRLHPV